MPTSGFIQDVFAITSNEVAVSLLTIDHADMGSPLRLCNDSSSISHGGNTYSPAIFPHRTPKQTGNESFQLQFGSADQQMVAILRALAGKDMPTAEMKVILKSSPETVEIGPIDMEIVSASADDFFTTAEMVVFNWGLEPCGITINGVNLPGVYS